MKIKNISSGLILSLFLSSCLTGAVFAANVHSNASTQQGKTAQPSSEPTADSTVPVNTSGM